MSYKTRFSKEEIRQIGIRMHSVRVLTGLNREEFGTKYDLPPMSIKNWELGRVLPKQEGINVFINALIEKSIFVSLEWILFGTGTGPNIINESNNISIDNNSEDFTQKQIELFKESKRFLDLNPIVCELSDSLMEPFYLEGDILGGVLTEENKVKEILNDQTKPIVPWLVSTQDGNFILRWLYLMQDKWFTRSHKSSEIVECISPSFANICFHLRPHSSYKK